MQALKNTTRKVLLVNAPKFNALEHLCFAASVCYQSETKKLTKEEQEKLIVKILRAQHFAILEHVFFSFYITGISRNCTHQIVRHRHFSFTQQSLHFTKAKSFSIPIPKGLTQGQKELWESAQAQTEFVYRGLINAGISKESARHILPSGIETAILMTGNLRAWLEFLSKRCCKRNCEEILHIAFLIRELLIAEVPFMTNFLGPTCLTEGVCREGEKFCGKPNSLPCTIMFRQGKQILQTAKDLSEYQRDNPKK